MRPSAVVVTVKLPGDDLGSGINSGGDTRLEEVVVVVRGEEDDDRGVVDRGRGRKLRGRRRPRSVSKSAQEGIYATVAKLPDRPPRVQAGPRRPAI